MGMFLLFLSREFRTGKGVGVLSHFDLLHFPGDQPRTNRGGGKSWFTNYRFSPKLDSPLVFPISGNDTTSHSVAQVPNLGVYFVLSSPLSPIFRPLAGFIDFSFRECLKPVHSSLSPPYPSSPMRFFPPVITFQLLLYTYSCLLSIHSPHSSQGVPFEM